MLPPAGASTLAMDLPSLEALRRTHPGWRLLIADHAPFVASFLHGAFIVPNARSIPQAALAAKLDDALFAVREIQGPDAFPRPAVEYLDDWAGEGKAWLRKFYPPGVDEPAFDLTSAAENAIGWLAGLVKRRRLVATESRLLTVLELLRQLTTETETDPAIQLAELERRRARLDAEIERVREGRLATMEPARVQDRFLAMAETARSRRVSPALGQDGRGSQHSLAIGPLPQKSTPVDGCASGRQPPAEDGTRSASGSLPECHTWNSLEHACVRATLGAAGTRPAGSGMGYPLP